MNKTALITGASSGIGLALAKCFAKDSFNLVLVGRNADALISSAALLQNDYKVAVQFIVADLATHTGLEKVKNDLQQNNIEIDILVNNAGFGLWGKFFDTDYLQESSMVHTHINALLYLTKLVLPTMLAKRSGKIINMGSVYCYSPVPSQSVYAATKSFMASFTFALQNELINSGVTAYLVCPGTTLTGFRRTLKKQHKLILAMTAEQVADITYSQIKKNKPVIVPGFFNKLYVFVAKHLPVNIIKFIVYKMRGLKI